MENDGAIRVGVRPDGPYGFSHRTRDLKDSVPVFLSKNTPPRFKGRVLVEGILSKSEKGVFHISERRSWRGALLHVRVSPDFLFPSHVGTHLPVENAYPGIEHSGGFFFQMGRRSSTSQVQWAALEVGMSVHVADAGGIYVRYLKVTWTGVWLQVLPATKEGVAQTLVDRLLRQRNPTHVALTWTYATLRRLECRALWPAALERRLRELSYR